jgi:large subunit ribosomal protein L25
VSENLLVAEERTEFGKGAARRVRRAHKVPAVLYGHGMDPKHLSLPGHDLMLALKHGGTNALLTLEVDGEERLALPKAVTRDPIRGFLEHVDLVVVRRGEKVTVDVAIHLTGESDREVLVTQPVGAIRIEAEATHLPERFEYDISKIVAGDNITADQIELPAGSTLVSDAHLVVVSGQAAPTAAQLESELAEAEAEVGITPTVDESAEGETAEGEAAGDDEPAEAPAAAE